jgi:hypothetical protein
MLLRLHHHHLKLAGLVSLPARRLNRLYTMQSSPYILPTISLNPNEARLAKLLIDCADWVDQHPEEVDKLRLRDGKGGWIGKLRGDEKVELRIAGGWVRDKVSLED